MAASTDTAAGRKQGNLRARQAGNGNGGAG